MMNRVKKLSLLIVACTVAFSAYPNAQLFSQMSAAPVLDHAWREFEYPPFSLASQTYPPIYQEVDMLHYTIEAEFNLGASYPDTAYLDAVTTISGKAKAQTLNQLIIDLYDNITINSLTLNGNPFSSYTRSQDKILMDLSADPIAPDEAFVIVVDYTHLYGKIYQGLMFRLHCATPPCTTLTGTPGICSVDQPYMAPGWFPCYNVPGDKATADIYMTFPDWMVGVANGLLQSEVNNGDGTKTAHWIENNPLYTDVLAVTMTDYVSWTDTYVSPLDATTMTIYYYAFPEDEIKARNDFPVTKDAMEYFAQIYGEYPFINEKYALAETLNSMGSVENQTMTSLAYRAARAAVNWDVIVHELAHQWWGDWVTCATWNHLWLHEGLATYSEVLFHEYDSGEPAGPFMAVNYDDGLYAGELAETVYVEDEDLLMPFLPTGAIYEKGGWVFHMLRYIMGDVSFINALKAFGAAHAYGNATTDDLKSVLETYYGSSLTDFFNQWIYTPYRPTYEVTYENSSREGGYEVDVNLRQTQGHSVLDIAGTPLRNYYIMPVEFTVHYTDDTTETFSVNNIQRDQSFQLLTAKQPEYTVFDEDVQILKVAEETVVSDNDGIFIDGDYSGIPGDNFCAGGATENCDDNCPADTNSAQEDTLPPGGNGCGNACDCEGNFNGDNDCDGSDAAIFKVDFGRNTMTRPCNAGDPCNGDFSCNGNVDGSDAARFKSDFGRNGLNNPCPSCATVPWCSY